MKIIWRGAQGRHTCLPRAPCFLAPIHFHAPATQTGCHPFHAPQNQFLGLNDRLVMSQAGRAGAPKPAWGPHNNACYAGYQFLTSPVCVHPLSRQRGDMSQFFIQRFPVRNVLIFLLFLFLEEEP